MQQSLQTRGYRDQWKPELEFVAKPMVKMNHQTSNPRSQPIYLIAMADFERLDRQSQWLLVLLQGLLWVFLNFSFCLLASSFSFSSYHLHCRLKNHRTKNHRYCCRHHCQNSFSSSSFSSFFRCLTYFHPSQLYQLLMKWKAYQSSLRHMDHMLDRTSLASHSQTLSNLLSQSLRICQKQVLPKSYYSNKSSQCQQCPMFHRLKSRICQRTYLQSVLHTLFLTEACKDHLAVHRVLLTYLSLYRCRNNVL